MNKKTEVMTKTEVLARLAKLTPQDLAKVQMFVERQRVRKLAKAAEPARPWGGKTVGWPTP